MHRGYSDEARVKELRRRLARTLCPDPKSFSFTGLDMADAVAGASTPVSWPLRTRRGTRAILPGV